MYYRSTPFIHLKRSSYAVVIKISTMEFNSDKPTRLLHIVVSNRPPKKKMLYFYNVEKYKLCINDASKILTNSLKPVIKSC